jgi:two-component system, NtrC family, sensor kinase
VQSAVRLLRAHSGMLTRVAGDWLELAAFTSIDRAYDDAIRAYWPRPLHSKGGHTQAIRERAPINIADAGFDPRVPEAGRAVARLSGLRSVASVPLLRNDEAIGTVVVNRQEPGGFTDDEIALLQIFADQAVIAIENVRLLNELQERNASLSEALDQQKATSEILRVISESPTDVQPVFETIVQSAAQLCEATFAVLHRFDGQVITFDAHHGMTEQEVAGSRDRFPLPTDRGTAVGRAILDRRTTHIHDIRRDAEYRVSAWQTSFQTVLAVPLLREGVPVGAIGLWRREVRPFSEKQITLVETFADQAVIAIENVRLFTELEARNRDLTATSEILRVISASPTDVQPVFDAIVRSAVRLCNAMFGSVFKYDGTLLHFVAGHQLTEEALGLLQEVYPIAPRGVNRRVIVDREPVNVADALNDPRVANLELIRRLRYRSQLAVPMLQGGKAIGTINVYGAELGPFSDGEVGLLKTFADQAVIAIENARLFNETKEALEQQTATADIL